MVPRFRAWDKETKKMWNIEIWHIEDEYVDLIEPSKNVADFTAERAWRKQSDIILMQSTGLKDMNGVEIYCGDIVSVRNHPFQKTEKSGAGIEIDGDYAISWNEGDLTWCAGNLLLARLKPYVTVAGNVWENPELLEQANEN